jgi:hypothetical protein
MTTKITDSTLAAMRRALSALLTQANGGTPLDSVILHVGRMAVNDIDHRSTDRRSVFAVTVAADGRLSATVFVALSWTMLAHVGFRFLLTPGGELILLGQHRGATITFRVEDDALVADRGSPLLSSAAEDEAVRAFEAELAALIAEVR